MRGVACPIGYRCDTWAKVTFKDAVDADWMKSRQYGVTGVPTFVAGGAGAVGCQPYEVLEQLMTHAKAAPAGS